MKLLQMKSEITAAFCSAVTNTDITVLLGTPCLTAIGEGLLLKYLDILDFSVWEKNQVS